MLQSQYRQIVSTITASYPTTSAIYLFGSRATEREKADSDWDIALLTAEKLPPLERWQLSGALCELLDGEVDLVDLLTASTVFQMQIVTTGKLLFQQQPATANFEMQVFSMYGRLQESRREIVEQFISETKNA